MPKFCKDCEFYNRSLVPMPGGGVGEQIFCTNENYLNPVDASPMPCGMLRSNEAFCGISGKGWKEKQAEVKSTKKDETVIKLL